jgi:hypothetical protein
MRSSRSFERERVNPGTVWPSGRIGLARIPTASAVATHYGVQHFLSAFGFMVSINDLWFDAPTKEDSWSGSAEFDRLKERAWELAKAAERDLPTSS